MGAGWLHGDGHPAAEPTRASLPSPRTPPQPRNLLSTLPFLRQRCNRVIRAEPDRSSAIVGPKPAISLRPEARPQAIPWLASSSPARADSRIGASAGQYGWGGLQAEDDPAVETRRTVDRWLNVSVLGAVGAIAAAKVLTAESGVWDLYQHAVATNPIEAKACISGMVYSFGDLIAQGYEGRDAADWDRGRILRSGLCGLLAHGPLSHLYYVGLDHVFAQQMLLPTDSWAVPLVKIAIDQTAWSLVWNSSYYVLLGLLKFESAATIAQTVRSSWWDLLKAGWRLWPLVHVFTYGIIPVQHRLLFVDVVELVWVSILSAYAQQQRREAEVGAEAGGAPAAVACALPGADGEGGDAAEEILRGMRVEREIVFEDTDGNRTVASIAEVFGGASDGAPPASTTDAV